MSDRQNTAIGGGSSPSAGRAADLASAGERSRRRISQASAMTRAMERSRVSLSGSKTRLE